MSFLTLVNVFSFLAHTFLAIFVLVKNPKASLNRVGAALIGCFAIWSFGAMFMCNHYIPKKIAWLLLDVIFFGSAWFMGLTFRFYLIFTERKKLLEKKTFWMLSLCFPMFFIYLQWRQRAIIADVIEVSYGWTLLWARSSWTYIYEFYYFLSITVALYLLVDFLRKTKSPIKRKHTLVVMTAKSIAFISGTTTDILLPHLLNIHSVPVMGNVFVLIWIAGLVYAIVKYKLFTVNLATAAENIISTMTDCLILLDPQGRVQRANEACRQMLGYSEHQLKGKPLNILLFPEQAENTYLGEMMSGKKLSNFYLTLRAEDGKQVPVSLSTAVLFDEEGGRAGTVWIARDITERKQAEEEKAKIQAQLLQSQKMEAIGLLAGGVAHDFNNLLTTIQGYISLALMNIPDTDPIARDLNQARQAAGRAANLTRQLLLFSRKQPMEPAPVDLNYLIDNLVKMLHRLLGEDITITTELEPDLWLIWADEGTIEQVIMNLAVNARDAMPKGGKLTISTGNVTLDEEAARCLSEARPGKFVFLRIADTGYGMDKKTMERIFEPFFTTKEIGKGTGLGLSVVYGIVKQHDGWINVSSSPGKGSVFTVYLPAMSLLAECKRREEISLQSLKGRNERILMVEDEYAVRIPTVRMLIENNYRVSGASSGQEALETFSLEGGGFDLALIDVVLPDQTGLELAEQLLIRQPELKILMTSGYTDHKSQWPAIQKRGFGFIQKPYALDDLLFKVRQILETGKVKERGKPF